MIQLRTLDTKPLDLLRTLDRIDLDSFKDLDVGVAPSVGGSALVQTSTLSALVQTGTLSALIQTGSEPE